MSSSKNPPFRQPQKPDPVDAMIEEWRGLRENDPGRPKPMLSQLELMIMLLRRS